MLIYLHMQGLPLRFCSKYEKEYTRKKKIFCKALLQRNTAISMYETIYRSIFRNLTNVYDESFRKQLTAFSR